MFAAFSSSSSSLILVLLLHLCFFLSVLSQPKVQQQQQQKPPPQTLHEKSSSSSKIETTKRRLKVLVYSPTISWSHTQFLGKIADTLAEAGHEVHFLKFVTSPGLRDKNETRLVHKVWKVEKSTKSSEVLDSIVSNSQRVANGFKGSFSWLNAFDHVWNDILILTEENCRDIVGKKFLFEQLAAEQFDVGIVEVYDLCPLAILQLAGVRVKLIAEAVPLYQTLARRFGISTFSSYVKHVFLYNELNDDGLSFIDRLRNFYDDFYDWAVMDDRVLHFDEKMLYDVIGPHFPPMAEILRSVSLVFVNSNPFFDLPRPTSNKIVQIGGIVSSKLADERWPPPLEKSVAEIFENAIGGVVLISFGTIAQTAHMSTHMRRSILRALARFPEIKFLWKMEKASRLVDSEAFDASSNVYTLEWLNQRVLLRHPKMRGFVSHCGWNSVLEAAEAGVPLLGVPLMYEQPVNLGVAIRHGMGVHLSVHELNGPEAEESLVVALKKLLFDKNLRKNAETVKRKLAMSPFSPKENLVRWVEFAAEFPQGALGELNLPGDEELHWFAYYSLDVLLFSAAILFSFLALAFWVVGKIVNAFLEITKSYLANNEAKQTQKSTKQVEGKMKKKSQ